MCLAFRFSLWCFLERMLWDKLHQTFRCLPVLEELPIKSIALLTRYVARHDYLLKIQIQFEWPKKMYTSWRFTSYEVFLMYCIFAVLLHNHTCQFWVQGKHAVDQMQNLNSQFACLFAYDKAICHKAPIQDPGFHKILARVHNKLACTQLQAKQKTMKDHLKPLWVSNTFAGSGQDSRFTAPNVYSLLMILLLLSFTSSLWIIMCDSNCI